MLVVNRSIGQTTQPDHPCNLPWTVLEKLPLVHSTKNTSKGVCSQRKTGTVPTRPRLYAVAPRLPWARTDSTHLDLHLVPLLRLLHLAVFVPELSLLLLQLPPCDLPEGVDFVTLQLEVVALLSLSVQLLPDAGDMFLYLSGHSASSEAPQKPSTTRGCGSREAGGEKKGRSRFTKVKTQSRKVPETESTKSLSNLAKNKTIIFV